MNNFSYRNKEGNKLEILFKNETKFGEEQEQILKRFLIFKCKNIKFLFVYFLVISAFAISIALYINNSNKYLESQGYNSYEKMLIGVSIAIIFLIAMIIIMADKARKNKKKQAVRKEVLNTYEFHEEYLVVSRDTITSKIVFKEMGDIKDVCKYKGYIFIRPVKNGAWMINENGFTEGNKDDFDEYVQDRFNKKIKYYN